MYKSIGFVVLLLCLGNSCLANCSAQARTDKSVESARGKREHTPRRSTRSTGDEFSSSHAYVKYTEGLMKNYDRDRDGFLDASELERMRRPPMHADVDGDGKVSKDELYDSVSFKGVANSKTARARRGATKNELRREKCRVVSERKELSVVGAKFYLMQFGESEATREQFSELLASIDGPEVSVQSIIAEVCERDDLEDIDELQCQLVRGQEVQISGQTHQRGTNMHLSAKLMAAQAAVRCRIQVSKNYLVSKTKCIKPKNESRSNLQIVNADDKLERMIIAKIEEKKRSLQAKRNAESHGNKILKSFEINTTLVGGLGGFDIVSVTSEGSRWILIADFNPVE